MGAVFLGANRNKRSIVLDLKQPEGRAVLLDLVREADVFVHSMRPKAIRRLGLDYATLRSLNDGLVYCNAWGFRHDGPYGNRRPTTTSSRAFRAWRNSRHDPATGRAMRLRWWLTKPRD